jgi:serine/threonine-protein kinase
VSDVLPAPWAVSGLTPGMRIARYRLEELIGHGGMAVVFRAHDEHLNRQVALKIIAPAAVTDEAFRRRFIRESRALAAVDDPNIIPVFEAGDADGVLFIAMRLVRGGDLRSLVAAHGPLPLARAGSIVSAVASALDTAHAAGLVHRDVKPANMLLDARPPRPDHVYLSDFGLSKVSLGSSGLTDTGQFLGTVAYVAPEQIRGEAVDGRTDQYALGCSAFELLCGRSPFARDIPMAELHAHLFESPPSLRSLVAGLPGEIDVVFAKALAKSPAGRYATCQDFAYALLSALRAPQTAWPGSAIDDPGVSDDEALAVATQGRTAGGERPTTPRPVAPGGSGSSAVIADPVLPDTTEPNGARSGETETRVVDSLADDEPGSPGLSGPPPGQPQVRAPKSRRPLVAGLLAGLALIGGVSAVLLTRSPAPGSTSPSVAYTFPQYRDPDGLVLIRHWTLGGPRGSSFTETIRAYSTTGKTLTIHLQEPVPPAIASNLTSVQYTRAPASTDNTSHVVMWNLTVPPQGSIVVGYQVRVPATGATRARLERWVSAFDVLEAQITPKSAARLTSLRIQPRTLRIADAATRRLTLSGAMSNGIAAPASVLSGVVWTSGNSNIATVSASGTITARAPGTTRVMARIGAVSVSIVVTVSNAPPIQGTPRPTPSSTITSHPL